MLIGLIEIGANITALSSVILTVLLRKSLYPVGILSTVLFFIVFWNAKLYASAGLQVYFTVIQFYGWWFWARGCRGREPPIGDWNWPMVGFLGFVSAIFTAAVSVMLYRFTDARTPILDTAILAGSVLAQFLLDRKQLKSWLVWAVVDVVSVIVYGGQKLWLTTALYVLLLLNAGIGWTAWRRARDRELAEVVAGSSAGRGL